MDINQPRKKLVDSGWCKGWAARLVFGTLVFKSADGREMAIRDFEEMSV